MISEVFDEGEDFPIVGEPGCVELANSLYITGDECIDFIATPELAATWFRIAPLAPRWAPTAGAMTELHALRDAMREVLVAIVDRGPVSTPAVEAVNACLAKAPRFPVLVVHRGVTTRGHRQVAADEAATVLAGIAAEFVDTVSGGSVGLLRRCSTPGCGLFFIRNHPRRKYCDPSCEHRTRQARYQRRRKDPRSARGDMPV